MESKPNEPKQLTEHDIAKKNMYQKIRQLTKQRMLENSTIKCSNCWTKVLTKDYILEDQIVN